MELKAKASLSHHGVDHLSYGVRHVHRAFGNVEANDCLSIIIRCTRYGLSTDMAKVKAQDGCQEYEIKGLHLRNMKLKKE
ncbi:hypothetical protein TNIN_455891 [Trichonephila inaurata madagascariensis]|uniref:Uncharacterized protein n=1 Tax=Trichonephila inaurata madagascariensis TaxID=2747483 RepID=A0A8X6XBY2_9ARAC|nr:hypothetical protein TNIN_455891 [Trichonephila inaurata madagascariensis]